MKRKMSVIRNLMNWLSPHYGTVAVLPIALACFALLPTALAVDPPPDGGYFNQNTADDAVFSLTTGAASTAMGFDVLDSNTTGSDNALASWSWRVTHSLNNARSGHTATLLQNGMVLVAAGTDSHDRRTVPRGELVPKQKITATPSLS